MECLKRVDQPTIKITDNIKRTNFRDSGFAQAARGHFGALMQSELLRNTEPVNGSVKGMTYRFRDMVGGEVAPSKAPLPQDPAILSRHIKSLGYFYGADIVGICELPQWAVYSHDEDGNPVKLDHQFAILLVVD